MGNMAPIFEGYVSWTVRTILESEVRIKTPFEVVSAIPKGSSLFCILPTASTKYYAQLIVGIEEDDIEILFPGEMDPKVRKDAIGEVANVISGLFVADDQFIARFGFLSPSTPFFSEGAFTARQDWGLRGCVEANGKEMVLHFSIRELQESPPPASKAYDAEAPKREGSPD